jgi:hypothetical protein
MRCFAAIVLFTLTTVGCVGFSEGGGVAPSSDRNLAVPWPKTVLTVSYYAKRCPPGARCPLHVKSLGNLRFVRVVRNLHCDPPGGDYPDPSAACAALRRIVDKLATKDWICGCAAGAQPGDKAIGFYNGKRRTIPLDGCSLCNLSHARPRPHLTRLWSARAD